MITVLVFFADDHSEAVDFFHQIEVFELQGYRFEPYTAHRFDKDPDKWVRALLNWEGPSILLLDLDLRRLDKELEKFRKIGELQSFREIAERDWVVVDEEKGLLDSCAILLSRFARTSAWPFLLVTASYFQADGPWAAIMNSLPQRSYIATSHLEQRFPGLWPLADIGVELWRDPTKPIAAYRGRRLRTFPVAQRVLTEVALVYLFVFSTEGDIWDLDLRDWQTFRELLWQESSQWVRRVEGVQHERWAHHLPGGGHYTDAVLLPTVLFDYFISTARKVSPRFDSSHMRADQLEWSEGQNDKYSPWRAACQFDGGGRDLSSALRGIAQKQCDTVDIRVEIDFDSRLVRFGDCLWCNGVAIARHIKGIASCLEDEIAKRKEPVRGIFSVVASLLYQGESVILCALELRVSQSIGGEHIPLPIPSKASGKIPSFYTALRKCGARFVLDETEVRAIVVTGEIQRRIDAEGTPVTLICPVDL